MSLVRLFRKRSSVLTVLVAIALLLAPTLAVTAFNGHTSHSDPPSDYPIGTVCGDALAGPYSVSSFSGSSSFEGWQVTFTVSEMVLSGGASGTVTSSSGSVTGTHHGYGTLTATFDGMSGSYDIINGEMHIRFSVTNLQLDGAPVPVPSLPELTLSCSIPDTTA